MANALGDLFVFSFHIKFAITRSKDMRMQSKVAYSRTVGQNLKILVGFEFSLG